MKSLVACDVGEMLIVGDEWLSMKSLRVDEIPVAGDELLSMKSLIIACDELV